MTYRYLQYNAIVSFGIQVDVFCSISLAKARLRKLQFSDYIGECSEHAVSVWRQCKFFV